jgi:hypothetical protein
MNRKTFLQRTALLTLAAAGAPRLARASGETTTSDKYLSEKTGSNPTLVYMIMMPDGAADPANKDIDIPLSVFRQGSSGSPEETKYIFLRARVKNSVGLDTITLRRGGLVSGPEVLPPGFPKSPQLKLKFRENILLETGKSTFTYLKYTPPSTSSDEEDYGCFLTTACTAARNLPDDCRELTMLRGYRDSFMLPTAAGASRVKEYYNIAPAIVREINTRSNSAAIWDHVYETLVVPAVALIDAGRKAEAGEWYAAYVEDLKAVFIGER